MHNFPHIKNPTLHPGEDVYDKRWRHSDNREVGQSHSYFTRKSFDMNWVGGVRSRIRLHNERKQQKEYFEMKRHMKKVNRARPTSPGERRGISQDLISLQTISKVHDINKNVPRPSKRVTVVDLDKATPMKRRDENMDLGPISPVDRMSTIQILDSTYSFQRSVPFPFEKHRPVVSHTHSKHSLPETVWHGSLSRSGAVIKKFSLASAETETPFLPYSTPAPSYSSQSSTCVPHNKPAPVHRDTDQQHKHRHFWEDESPMYPYNQNNTGDGILKDRTSPWLRPHVEYNKLGPSQHRPRYRPLDDEYQRKRKFVMAHEDFQITPSQKVHCW
ncbi:hypothetical protein LSAT2_015329 [Lamellibrachia satsuma]|nr:hypothetical protein LSAT2_015329 [Lamellibrachia satsuma]